MTPRRPPFADYPTITTARLLLRPLTAADVPQIFPISFFEGIGAVSLAEAHEMQVRIRAEYAAGTLLHWGYALAHDPTVVVGTGGFYRGFAHDVGEIGYVLLPEYRGQGYATEAARAMVQFGFDTLGLRQVAALTDPLNATSGDVLRRAGFREVPTERPSESRKFVFDAPGGIG